MRNKTLSFLALLLSLSIYFSCIDEGVEVSGLQYKHPEPELLSYAKKMVGENGEGCSLIDLRKGSTNSRVVTDYSTVATPLWEKAKTEKHGDEEVLIVPLQSEDDIYSSLYFEEEEMGRLYQTKSFSRLVVRSKNGHTVTQVFTYLPGRNYAKNRQAVLDTMGFSPLAVKYYGTILISDLEGKFQQGFYYERGVPTIHLKPKKHTHAEGSRSINDSTECNHHEHSHSMDIRLRLSGNMRIASRNINEGEEVDFPCMFCGQSALTCSCFTVEGNYVYCDDCGNLKGQCVCLPTMTACGVCGMYYCICFEPCEECGSYPCVCDELIGGGNNSGGDNLGGGGSGGGSNSGNNSEENSNGNPNEEITKENFRRLVHNKRLEENVRMHIGIEPDSSLILINDSNVGTSNAYYLFDGKIYVNPSMLSKVKELNIDDMESILFHEYKHTIQIEPEKKGDTIVKITYEVYYSQQEIEEAIISYQETLIATGYDKITSLEEQEIYKNIIWDSILGQIIEKDGTPKKYLKEINKQQYENEIEAYELEINVYGDNMSSGFYQDEIRKLNYYKHYYEQIKNR